MPANVSGGFRCLSCSAPRRPAAGTTTAPSISGVSNRIFFPHIDLRWRNALVIYSASNYLDQDEHWATQLLVHELSHAWHLAQWPEKQTDIYAAWQQAMADKLYYGVKDVNGALLEKAYAAANQLEYFAELSSAYFWRGEYEPFEREALRRHDPAGFAMIEKMWGVQEPPPPPSERAGQVE
jgi:hypothetical protein